jgi:hypothetical protein
MLDTPSSGDFSISFALGLAAHLGSSRGVTHLGSSGGVIILPVQKFVFGSFQGYSFII